MNKPIPKRGFYLGIAIITALGLTATFDIGCLDKIFIQARKFTDPCAD